MEKLIDELDFEISQVESSVIIAVILIGEIEYDFVFFILIHRVQELVNQAICKMLDLGMTRHQGVKLERYLVAYVQICDILVLLGNEHAL